MVTRRVTEPPRFYGFVRPSDATSVRESELSLGLLIRPLHAFIAALYEIELLADICFFMQSTICAIN